MAVLDTVTNPYDSGGQKGGGLSPFGRESAQRTRKGTRQGKQEERDTKQGRQEGTIFNSRLRTANRQSLLSLAIKAVPPERKRTGRDAALFRLTRNGARARTKLRNTRQESCPLRLG